MRTVTNLMRVEEVLTIPNRQPRHTSSALAVTRSMETLRAAMPFVRVLVLAGLVILLVMVVLPAMLGIAAAAGSLTRILGRMRPPISQVIAAAVLFAVLAGLVVTHRPDDSSARAARPLFADARHTPRTVARPRDQSGCAQS